MSIVEIVSYSVAVIAAVSRLLDSAKPFWSKLPQPVAAFIPSVVVMLPQLSTLISGSKTTLDLVNAVVLAVALLLPGAAPKTTTPAE